MFDKIKELLKMVPVVNLLPAFESALMSVPKAWEALPEDKKQEYMHKGFAALAKAAEDYAKK